MKASALFVAVAAGCHGAVIHSPRNAPGHVPLAQPPAAPVPDKLEPPEDPGERMLVFSAGVLAGAGLAVSAWEGDAAAGTTSVGGELSLHLGERDFSHHGDDLFIYPQRAWGANLGLTVVDDGDARAGPLWLELQRTEQVAGSFAGGVAWDPGLGGFGGQVTAAFMGLYARASLMTERGFELTLGLVIKVPVIYSWSR